MASLKANAAKLRSEVLTELAGKLASDPFEAKGASHVLRLIIQIAALPIVW